MDEKSSELTYDKVVALLQEWETKVVVVSFEQGESVGRLTRVIPAASRARRGSMSFGCGSVDAGAEIDFHLSEQELVSARLERNNTWLQIQTKRGWLAVERDPAQYAHDEIP